MPAASDVPLLWGLLSLLIVNFLVLLWVALRRTQGPDVAALLAQAEGRQQRDAERLERELREAVLATARDLRAEVGQQLALTQQTLLQQSDVLGRQQVGQLERLAEVLERQMAELRERMASSLTQMQEGNERKLDAMRATVDEKLHATLEQRLGESFKQVADRLEQVHQGLGEMQGLAREVGSLGRVLSNVKTRGVFGEVQLAALLEQVFTPEQYAANVETVPGTGARVEFALKLPGGQGATGPLWLPIDAKFPREDYERLLQAQDEADASAVETAAKAIEMRLRAEAKQIRDKYLAPPHTTDFGILFVPTEGLYAEALRRPGLVESLQREHRILVAGPTTLLAVLNSLQMGFRTLAIEKRSAEVWEVLGAVKTEFGRFGEVLAKTKKKLEEASHTIDAAEVRTRAMTRRLKGVEAMPAERVGGVLGAVGLDDDEAGP